MKNNPQFSCYFNTTFILFSSWTHSHMHALLWLKSSIHHSLFVDFITWSWLRAWSQLDNDLFYTIAENVLYTGWGASTIWVYILHLCALKERKKVFFPLPKISMPYFYGQFGWREDRGEVEGSRVELGKNKLILC